MEGLAPPEVRDAAEFTAALRELRVRTGLSYRQLERLPDGTYRIKLHNARYGLGCATMDYGGTRDGLLLAGDSCGANRADQEFTLEPANGGCRLRSVPGSAYCIGVLSGRTDSGVQLIQNPCNGQADQLFVLG